MSTATSPLHVLQKEAKFIAKRMKQSALMIDKTTIKFGVVMDDKVITIEMERALILRTSHETLEAIIVREMRGEKQQ